jgi:hypothetical protein
VGVIYFYYNDIISQNPMEASQKFIPFSFALNLMKKLDLKGRVFKYIALYLSILAQVGISFSYHIFRLIYAESGYLSFKVDWIVISWFMIEKYIYVILFGIMLALFLVYPKTTFIKPFIESSILLPIYRATYCYFNILNSMVYLFYSIYTLQIFFNYQNTILITIGLLNIIFITSFLFAILFELPLRRSMRKLLGKTT